jgi:uncharacterized membrane protein
MSYISFIRFIPRYFLFLEAIVNGIVFLYSFSVCSLLVYKKSTDFCKSILYPATLQKVFMMSRNYLVEFFRSFRYKIMSFTNDMIVWLLYFLFAFLLFLLPLLFLWLGIPKLCWVRVRKDPVSFLTLEEMVSVFDHLVWCGYRVVVYILYYVEVHSFYS